ncbi:hypothetical protein ADICYQ_2897 [Cyclobacterium qasimii M12-11B]|uniref:Uncharacterized protein n=1 Tax=Cyclobacterium qasimii M12-11B TaxID=641524 RepID=S7VF61_9BACT|nr:hypothetical protein ADICYQ_2897 [Cyclobacterium qasimii M12-11B]
MLNLGEPEPIIVADKCLLFSWAKSCEPRQVIIKTKYFII